MVCKVRSSATRVRVLVASIVLDMSCAKCCHADVLRSWGICEDNSRLASRERPRVNASGNRITHATLRASIVSAAGQL